MNGQPIDLTGKQSDGQSRRARGIGHVPEDRQREGLIMEFAAWENLVFGYHHDDEYQSNRLLMNNAGITKWCEAEDVSEDDWRAVIDVNLNGLFFCCQAVAPAMMTQGGGRIVNIASMSGLIVNRPQCQASYNTSKAAVIHLTKSLAAEWAQYNIRVNSISPGYMDGPMAGPCQRTRLSLWRWRIVE